MTLLVSSLEARHPLPGMMTDCSWQRGWRSVLMRRYEEPREAEPFTTRPTPDHLIVLVTAGSCDIASQRSGEWKEAHYEKGAIGMTAPGESATLRWAGDVAHHTLQVHLPSCVLRSAHRGLSKRESQFLEMPSHLKYDDPVVGEVMLAMGRGLEQGAPDLYAESAAMFLATHLLVRHSGFRDPGPRGHEDARLERADNFLRDNLREALSLATIARAAGMSRFHLLRLYKARYGETPFRRLTRLRMDEAKRLLSVGRASITDVAASCGYADPAHFASAFRRVVGIAPSAYRRHRM